MTSATATAVRSRVLVSKSLDGWLVGWFAVATWLALWLSMRSGATVPQLDVGLYWILTGLNAMHFGISYHLAYADPRGAIRSRPIALFVVPAALIAALIALVAASIVSGEHSVRGLTGTLLTLVYLLTVWHYIKQAYGVARLGASYARITLTATEIRILRYGVYPLWWTSVVRLLTRGAPMRFVGYRVGASWLPHVMYDVMRGVALVCAVPIAIVFVQIAKREHRMPPALMTAPYAAALLWLGLPLAYVSSGLVLAAFHAMQYIACARRAEIAMAGPALKLDLTRWLEVFGGAVCGGLLVTTWMPGALNRALLSDGKPLLFSAAFFVFLNLHHYIVDAVIWRSRGELVRAMVA